MKKILVVDDNKITTDMVELILQSEGYDCTQVNSAKQCLQLLYDDAKSYDLVLLDLAMPELSGIDILKKLKQDGLLDSKKIVLFTASSISDSEKADLKKLGALDAMNKPFTKAELLDFVATHS
jgi:CheY-like chemotaxis protein